MTFIYSLSDSTGIRYIGKANNPNIRFKNHLKEGRNRNKYRKDKWIKSLLLREEKPFLAIIEEIPIKNWKIRETYWIQFFKLQGIDLVNGSNGGEGSDGFEGKHHSEATRQKIREKRINVSTMTNDGRNSIADKNRKRLVTKESRKKMSDKAKLRVRLSVTQEVKERISNSLKKRNEFIRGEVATRGVS